MLTGQVTTLRSKWTNASNDNMRLQAELGTLRKTLQVCWPLLSCTDLHQANIVLTTGCKLQQTC